MDTSIRPSMGAFAHANSSAFIIPSRPLVLVRGRVIARQFAGSNPAWLVRECLGVAAHLRQNETPAPRDGAPDLIEFVTQAAADCGVTPAGSGIGLLALSLNSTVMKTISRSLRFSRS